MWKGKKDFRFQTTANSTKTRPIRYGGFHILNFPLSMFIFVCRLAAVTAEISRQRLRAVWPVRRISFSLGRQMTV